MPKLCLAVLALVLNAQTANARLLDKCAWMLTSKFVNANHLPLDAKGWKGLSEPEPYAGLVTAQWEEWDEEWVLEGSWPEGLSGTYARVGPFGFDSLSGQRKRSAIDSAGGLLREYTLDPANPRFRARHVKTPAYLEERRQRKFLYPSIETLAPGNWNSALRAQNQSSVAVYRRQDGFWITDEMRRPVPLSASNLDTGAEIIIDKENPKAVYLAHAKRDPASGNLCFLSIKAGYVTRVQALCLDAGDRIVWKSALVDLPKSGSFGAPYFHDWALTENHLVFFLHPVFMSAQGLLKSVIGLSPMMTAVKPDPKVTAKIFIASRDGIKPALEIDTGASSVAWHFLNAYEKDKKLILDLAATSVESEMNQGPNSLYAAMRGEPINDSTPSSFIKRFSVDLPRGRLSATEVLLNDANYEFPTIAASRQGLPYRFAYLGRTQRETPWQTGIVKWDHQEQRSENYEFPAHQFVGEPFFAARDGAVEEDDGYVVVEVFDSEAKRNHLAVFDARRVDAGPIVRLWISKHLPLGFHGNWWPDSQ